jgi:hypothetical protein
MVNHSPLTLITQQYSKLHDVISKTFKGFGINPMPGSIAAKELALAENIEMVETAHNQGTLLIEVVSDHLSAFSREITEPVLPFAAWTNIRSVLEVSSISIWLLDEHINIKERISRSYAYRCQGLDQRVKYANATQIQTEIESAKKRQKEVLQKAKENGLTKDDKNGKIILVYPMPKITDMVHAQLNEEATYRLLSNMTHAHQWALISLGYTHVADIPRGKLLKKTISIGSISYLSFTGIKAYQKTIMCKCKLFGWPTDDIQTAFDNTSQTISGIFKESINK